MSERTKLETADAEIERLENIAATQAKQIERLLEQRDIVTAERGKWQAACREAQAAHDNALRELVAHREIAHGNYWGWQSDGENFPESLVCPVLIPAVSLREIIAERDRLRKALEQIRDAKLSSTDAAFAIWDRLTRIAFEGLAAK